MDESQRGLLASFLRENNKDDYSWVFSTTTLFMKVTRSYDTCLGSKESADDMLQVVDSALDAILQPICSSGLATSLVNEVLVHIGLLKSEDKKFKPVEEINGPLLALKHVVRQDYFPKESANILIAFLTKPNPLLYSIQMTTVQVLHVLHTL